MRITKYVHSCLLVENDGEVVLFDPGDFALKSGLLNIENLPKLDFVVITHGHFDHFNEELVSSILAKFPEVVFVATNEVIEKLKQLGAKNTSNESVGKIQVFSNVPHASLEPFGQAPENIAVHYDGKLTVGGDRHDLEETKEVLALTITGPWGSMMGAGQMVDRLKPETIIPVHDWHWNEEARLGAYDRFESRFKDDEIKVIKPVDGVSFEV